jgi:hypothetical protein
MNIVNLDVFTASLSAKDIVVLSLLCRSTGYVPHDNVLDDDAIRWVASRTTVQVVLLNVDAVVGDEASGVRVGLDAGSILGVEDNRVGERYVRHIVV